jgi:dTDP-4-dehydrorhamnose 3,5-epimerase
MQIEQTSIEGCFIVYDTFYGDTRGYFFESFNKKTFLDQTGVDVNFVQDNQSSSTKGVLRGLHFQHGEFAQAKLVRVLHGAVLDVAVDLRKNSKTFGQHVAVELTSENKKQLFVPRGFAHGFVVLSDQATFFYKCDNYYNKASDGGVAYNDTDLAINWILPQNELILSDKDLALPTLRNSVSKL